MNKTIKKCLICGEIASGFNYEVLSCESCKVFFCRNASRPEKYQCEQNGSCEIDYLTRTKCPKCRLTKCFASGMRKKKWKKIATNNNSDHDNYHQQAHSSSSSSSSSLEEEPKTGAKLFLEISILKRFAGYDMKQISDYIKMNLNNNNHITEIPTKRIPIELNQYELECLDSVRNAFRHEPNPVVSKHATQVQDFLDASILNTVVYLKKGIRFCSNFGAFNSLSNADQLALLKPFCHSLTMIWNTFCWKLERNGNLVVTNETETDATLVPKEIIYACFSKNEPVLKSFNYYNRLYYFMENDVNIRDLVTALLLFKTQQNLSSSSHENIRYHHFLYSLLLQRYLQSKHQSRKQGNRKYGALMRLLDKLDGHLEHSKAAFNSEIGVQNLPTVVRELNDLV